MPDREKVITHLQIIYTWAEFARERDLQFFTPGHLKDIAQWADDALAMLEEQEAKKATPRLLTPEEVQTMKAGTSLVVERFIKHNGKAVPMACWAINTGSLILSFHGTMFPDTVHKIPYVTIVQNREGKGHHNEYFRFWSDKPSKEQMEQEEWEGIEGDGC